MKGDVWDRMILQGEPHLKNRIDGPAPVSLQAPARVRQTAWRSRRIPRLPDAPQCKLSENGAVGIDLAAQRNDAGAVAHCFAHGLLGPVRDGRADQDVLARPSTGKA